MWFISIMTPIETMVQNISKYTHLSDGTSQLYLIDNKRVLRLTPAAEIRRNLPTSDEEDGLFLAHRTDVAMQELTLLATTYGLAISPFRYEIVAYQDRLCVAAVVPYVAGQSLFEAEIADIPFGEIKGMITSYAAYLSDKYKQQKPSAIWTDVNSKQFMYGSIPGSHSKKVWLTDIDPIVFIHPTRLTLDDANDRLERMIVSFSEQVPRHQASQLRDVLSHIPAKSPAYDPYKRHPYVVGAFE